MNAFAEEISQRMLQSGSYNVPLIELERRWKAFDSDATLAEDFIAWCARNGWRAQIVGWAVEVRR